MARRHGELCISKQEMRDGLQRGRVLIQEEWAHPDEIRFVDELVTEGVTQATAWTWSHAAQCERRRVSAAAAGAGAAP